MSLHFLSDTALLGVRIVFLVAEPVNGDTEDREAEQGRLIREAETIGDILQPGPEDNHRKLSDEWTIQYPINCYIP